MFKEYDNSMRIVVLATAGHLQASIILKRLLCERNDIVALIETGTPFSDIKKTFLVGGVNYFFYKAIEFGFFKIGMLLHAIFGKKNWQFSNIHNIAKEKGIKAIKADNINSEKSLKKIRELKPDLIVSAYFGQILKEEIISSAKNCINIHPSPLPKYRGISPYFWAISNNEKEAGITVHFLEKKVDAGGIILQKIVKIEPKETVHGLFNRLSNEGAGILLKAIAQIEKGKVVTKKQNKTNASYFSSPTKKAVKKLYSNGRKLIAIKEIFKIVW